MKRISKNSLLLSLGILSFALCLSYSNVSWAQVNSAPHHHWRRGKSFRRGVCVGQTLAKEGIVLPNYQPGQPPVFDAPTQAAFKAAVQSCRAQFKGTKPSPSGVQN